MRQQLSGQNNPSARLHREPWVHHTIISKGRRPSEGEMAGRLDKSERRGVYRPRNFSTAWLMCRGRSSYQLLFGPEPVGPVVAMVRAAFHEELVRSALNLLEAGRGAILCS